MRRTFDLFICAAIIVAMVEPSSRLHAQAFDGTWTGTLSCPAQRGPGSEVIPAFSTPIVTATILQNQFRLEANLPNSYRFDQGVIRQDGSISITGYGQRRDVSSSWTMQFSGKATPGRMTLTGNEGWRSPCTLSLSNIRPAPYSPAAKETTQQQQLAPDAEGQAAEGRAQREKSAKEKAAEAQLQRLRTDADIAKQKAAEFDKKLSAQTEKQQSADAQLQQLRTDAEAAKTREDEAEKELAALRTTQAHSQEQQKEIGDFLQDSMLPVSENLSDWISIVPSIPIQEQQFCTIVRNFYPKLTQVAAMRNEIRRNMLFREREKDFDALLPRGRFENWVLRVKAVEQSDNGDAEVILYAPCKIKFGSSVCQKQKSNVKATIKKDTPMFRELAKVGVNDFVVVSGTILLLSHDDETQELPKYASLKPGEYCWDEDSEDPDTKESFGAELRYFVKLK